MTKPNCILVFSLCLIIAACGNHRQTPANGAFFDSVSEALSNDGHIDL